MNFKELEPSKVFEYFFEINQIPRESGQEKAVSDYIAAFAKDLGLPCTQDKYNNLIITKPGTPGHKSKKPVMLQAHLDMVCEKNNGTEHDFSKALL